MLPTQPGFHTLPAPRCSAQTWPCWGGTSGLSSALTSCWKCPGMFPSRSSIHLAAGSSKALEPCGNQAPHFRCWKSPSFSFRFFIGIPGSVSARRSLGGFFFPRISSGSQFIRYYQGLDSSETFANGLEFCLEPGSGSAKDVTAILGFEEPIHPRVLCQWEWELQQCRKDQWP